MAKTAFGTVRGVAAVAALGAGLGLGSAGCGGSPDPTELGEVPSAEQLYQEAREILADGSEILWVFDTTKYQDAIDRLQDIIDNYP